MLRNIKIRQRKGQSTVEYIVLVAAVLAVIIAFVSSPGGPFQSKVQNSLNDVTEKIDEKTTDLGESLSRNVTRNDESAITIDVTSYNAFGAQ